MNVENRFSNDEIEMERLNLETFFSTDKDLELNQYRILGSIKLFQQEFNGKKLYPALGELIKLNTQLSEIINNRDRLKISFPKIIKDFDFKTKNVIYDAKEKCENVSYIFDLVEWALPIIKKAIEEGIVLYEFVENNLTVEQLGIMPIYKEEGYLIIRGYTNKELKVYKFECSLFTSDTVPYRALKTEHIKNINCSDVFFAPADIKLELVRDYPDLPNPAIYLCETELDFPFTETIFPIAKRKLMSTLAS